MEVIDKYNFFDQLKALSFVEEIWLFGSRARGDYTDRSDIDIAILSPHANSQNWEQVLEIVEEADTLLKIDVIRLDELGHNNSLRKSIYQFGSKLYQRQEDEPYTTH
jgi:predicted nucleotidyltransferase